MGFLVFPEKDAAIRIGEAPENAECNAATPPLNWTPWPRMPNAPLRQEIQHIEEIALAGAVRPEDVQISEVQRSIGKRPIPLGLDLRDHFEFSYAPIYLA
jgi:hypothetical protein